MPEASGFVKNSDSVGLGGCCKGENQGFIADASAYKAVARTMLGDTARL